MKRLIYSLILAWALGLPALIAQYNWKHAGPLSRGHVTRSLIFDANKNLLAAVSGGGIWKSSDEGYSWEKLPGYTGSPSVTSLIRNGNTIYAATGDVELVPFRLAGRSRYDGSSAEGMIGYSGIPGQGIYISNDNGATWSNANALTDNAQFPTLRYDGPFAGIQKLLRSASGRIFIASRSGLYYSDDANLAAVTKAGGSANFQNAVVYDIEIAANNVVFVGTADSLYRSTDGGENFTAVRDASLYQFGQFSTNRVEVAVSPSNPNIVYAAGSRIAGSNQLTGIWRSDDAGASWRLYAPPGGPDFNPIGGNARDAFLLAVKPYNEDGVIIAGATWYTFTGDRGWLQTAQHSNPNGTTYIPRSQYCVLFDPEDTQQFFIGTSNKITYSPDGGSSFYQRAYGYAAVVAYSVTSIGIEGNEAVIAATPTNGLVYNGNFWKEQYSPANPGGAPNNKGFGQISTLNNGYLASSYLYPGSIVSQGSDIGVVRAVENFGSSFAQFYSLPLNTDTLVRPSTGQRDSAVIAPLRNISGTNYFIDRSSANVAGGNLVDNGKMPVSNPFVLDEYIPGNYIAPATARTLAELRNYPGKDSLRKLANYLFMPTTRYVWLCNYPLGNPQGLNPRWDRITNDLVGQEYYTAMEVSGDDKHILYVGTSQGKLWRITGSADFETFDATTRGPNIVELTAAPGLISTMAGRWISDIAVNPKNPNQLVITFGAYGGTAGPANVWLVNNANTSPSFTPFSRAPKEPAYTCKFVEYQPDPANPNTEAALFIGTESGMYSTRQIAAAATWTAELPVSYGKLPVYDIYVRKYQPVITDEETRNFVLRRDNTLFAATHGYGIWFTEDARFNFRQGNDPGEDPALLAEEMNASFFPNPANGISRLRIEAPEAARAEAQFYTSDGRMANFSLNDNLTAGRHEFVLDTRNFAPGMYVLRVNLRGETRSHSQTIKVLINP